MVEVVVVKSSHSLSHLLMSFLFLFFPLLVYIIQLGKEICVYFALSKELIFLAASAPESRNLHLKFHF